MVDPAHAQVLRDTLAKGTCNACRRRDPAGGVTFTHKGEWICVSYGDCLQALATNLLAAE